MKSSRLLKKVISDQCSVFSRAARAFVALITVHCLLITAPAASAASVTGTLLNPDATPFTNVVLFRPKLDRAVLISSTLTPFVDTRVVPATNGGITATLRAGDYLVYAGASRPFAIAVPDSTNSYELTALVTGTNILSAGPFNIVSTTIGDATASAGGKVKTDSTASNPTVYLKDTTDTLLATKSAATNGTVVQLTGSLTNITVDGAYVLRIPPFTAAINAVTVPVAYQYFQRTNSSSGLITITANIAGPTGTAVEARFGSGSWASIGSSDSAGNITGYLAASVGGGDVQVRLTGTTNATTISNVRVGDIYLIAGQSNGSGRSTSNQATTNSLSGLYGNDAAWKALVDPVDSSTNQVDTVSSDYDAGGMGSVWPLVADEFIATTGVPIAFVPCAKGSTGFGGSQPTWTPAADHFDTATLFGSAMSRLRSIGGKVAAVLWWQGEGGFDDTTGAIYNTPFSVMAAAIATEFPGTKVIPAKLQDCTGITSSRQTNAWYAIGLLWSTNANVLRGPTLADAPVGGAGNIFAENESGTPYYHIKTSTNTVAAAHRWATNLIAHFP